MIVDCCEMNELVVLDVGWYWDGWYLWLAVMLFNDFGISLFSLCYYHYWYDDHLYIEFGYGTLDILFDMWIIGCIVDCFCRNVIVVILSPFCEIGDFDKLNFKFWNFLKFNLEI